MYIVPTRRATSARRKGVVSEFVAVYSPGRNRKKKARQMQSAIAELPGYRIGSTRLRIHMRTDTGTGFTRFGGGSCLV